MSLASNPFSKPYRLAHWKSLPRWMVLILGLSFCLASTQVRAQDKDEKNSEKKADEVEVPEPEDPVELTTDDGLEMKGTFFPGTKGRRAFP